MKKPKIDLKNAMAEFQQKPNHKGQQQINKKQLDQNKMTCSQIQTCIKRNKNRKISLVKQIKSCIYLPALLLLTYFTLQMIILSSIELSIDIYASFKHFFASMKRIFQQNSLFLLFWAVIIIKTKIPQLQRLFYHTIIKSILQGEDTQCSICLNDQCDYIIPKCQHHYHAACLEKWLKTQGCCPYCRSKCENKIVRKVLWKQFFLSVTRNKIKWILVLIVCIFIQYRFSDGSLLMFPFKHRN